MKKATYSLLTILILLFSQTIYADYYYSEENDASDEQSYSSADYDNSASYQDYQSSPDESAYSHDYSEPVDEEEYRPRSRHHYSEESHHAHGQLPSSISPPGERVIIVNPHVHAWGAYSENGKLLKSGLASAGSSWCNDLGRPCRTRSGTFRIYSLGSEGCYSRKFPLGRGGAPMPYCMYFNGGQGIHGSHELANANISHGCVRVSVSDAEWIRFNFARMHTKVIVKPY